jgi:hypothetical protein
MKQLSWKGGERMTKLLMVVVVMAMLAGVVVPVLAQSDSASACIVNGYSPGYFKNHLDAWGTVSPYAYFDEVFHRNASWEMFGPHATLIDVLNTGGGKFDALNRQAVAALINSGLYYPNWYSKSYVQYAVRDAYLTGDWSTPKALFEAANSLN